MLGLEGALKRALETRILAQNLLVLEAGAVWGSSPSPTFDQLGGAFYLFVFVILKNFVII